MRSLVDIIKRAVDNVDLAGVARSTASKRQGREGAYRSAMEVPRVEPPKVEPYYDVYGGRSSRSRESSQLDYDVYAGADQTPVSGNDGIADLLSSGGGYSERAHARANLNTANEAMRMDSTAGSTTPIERNSFDVYGGEANRLEDMTAAQTEFARQNDVALARESLEEQSLNASKASREALERVRGLEATAQSDISISGLLSRRAEIESGAMGVGEGMSTQEARALNTLGADGTSRRSDLARPLTDLEQGEISEINKAINRIMPGVDNYSEAVRRTANAEAITEGVTTGNTGMGMLQASASPASNGLMGSMENTGLGGIAASIGMGAVLGGTANYAMGGEFSEGAMMGGLAGGGVAIGARAIAANREGVSGFLQRQVLGGQASSDIAANAAAVRGMGKEAIGNLGFTQRAAHRMLMKDPASPGLQSRHMVIGGSMLAGVAFTGRRNDKRRGFNAHRGNRI